MKQLSQKQLITSKSNKIHLILQKANRLFCEQSYASTSIMMIAKEINVGRSLMYSYFSSKDKVLDQLLSQLLPMMTREIFSCVPEKGLTAAEQLRLIELNARKFWKKGVDFCLVPRLFMEFKCNPQHLTKLLKDDCQKWYLLIAKLTCEIFGLEEGPQKAEEIWFDIFAQGLSYPMKSNFLFFRDFYGINT